MKSMYCSVFFKKSNDNGRIVLTAVMGMILGYVIGVSFPYLSFTKTNLHPNIHSPFNTTIHDNHESKPPERSFPENIGSSNTSELPPERSFPENIGSSNTSELPKIYVPMNPRGAELLPPAIVVSETDFYLRRSWGEPSEDLKKKPKYLVTFAVGWEQRKNIDSAVKKFSDDFQIVLFHYDGRTTGWDQYEWSKQAIHISVRKQTKWWYAKRFLHPDIVAAYDYIFVWDEDLGVEHFNGETYMQLVKKYRLEISQPGLEPNKGITWKMTKRRGDKEVHKVTDEKPGWCSDPHLPPCAAFVEIMAPVFSRDAWRCVWYMIQNDLVHGWGLDFALRRCVDHAHDKIGVVDSQWIVHQHIPSLGGQGEYYRWKSPSNGVKDRCKSEWALFQDRLAKAEKAYLKQNGTKL